MIPSYAELHCLTNYSFLRGASDPEEVVQRAVELGYSAIAITDECSVSGVVRAHLAAKDTKLKLIIGSEFRLVDGLRFVLLVANLRGYESLCELITKGRRAAEKGEYRLERGDVPECPEGLLALWLPGDAPSEEEARWMKERFGEAWCAIELTRGPDDEGRIETLEAIAGPAGLKCLAAGDVHMHLRSRKRLQDVMTAIKLRRPLADVGRELQPNAERYLRPIGRIAAIAPARLLAATLDAANRCAFSLSEIRYEYPEELVPEGQTPATHLRKLTYEGVARRYPDGAPAAVIETIEYELRLITEMGYEPFFLTVQDIVNFARSQSILCQGRGSAANSAVCYCLGITEVDPGRMSVLFERFVSKERNEPPDIDVDFEHQRREEVIQYIYGKYGRERAALAAVVITYQPKSALRDVGKALGLSLDQVDLLAKSMSWWDDREAMGKRLAEAGFDLSNRVVKAVIELTQELIGFPRHLSQHPGGFVIDNRRLSRLVPVENASMPDRTVIQWDKDDLDALGLLKVDVLGLGMLSCLRRAIDLVNEYKARGTRREEDQARGTRREARDWATPGVCLEPRASRLVPLTLANIPPEDPATYEMIQRADTIGVFQIESRAQMSMLPRLKPTCFYDLVIEVAIVRPGPIMGGMVHPYLRRREGSEPVTYASEAVKRVLERTLGVSIFQEQVMQLAMVAAGFTPGEADQLRRAMASWKRRGGIEPFREKLINGMLSRGYTQAFAEQIYRQIQGFGEYGFPESHAASFALLVYVSCWLKRHEPAAFACALLNSQPLGFYSPSQIVQDVRRHGVEVRPADVLVSAVDSTLEPGPDGKPAIRLGLGRVSGLKVDSSKRIVKARLERDFESVDDLSRRSSLSRLDLSVLARADALANLSGHRRASLWETLSVDDPTRLDLPAGEERAPAGFIPKTEGQEIVADYEAMGLTLRRHPLALLRERLAKMKLKSAEDVAKARNGQLIRTSGIVTCRQRPATASGVVFVTLEDETGYVNVIVWNDLVDRQRKELVGSRLLGVTGQVQKQGLVVHVLARSFTDLTPMLGTLKTSSHDFH